MTRVVAALAVVALVGVTVATSLTRVEPGERAVVRRWGKFLSERPGPGLHVGWPWGIDRVDRVPIGAVRRVVVGKIGGDEAEDDEPNLTGDHNLVNVRAEIDYTVREDEIDAYVLMADRVDALVSRTAEAVLAEWIAGRTVDESLLRGRARAPALLVREIDARLRPYSLGIQIEQASLTRLNPPDEVREAFEAVARSQTAIRTKTNAAEEKANRIRRDAEADQYRRRQSAAAYAREQNLEARAEADAFTNRLRQYRELSAAQPGYLNILWQDQVARLFERLRGRGGVDLLDHHLGPDGLNITQFPRKQASDRRGAD